jgi:hypothetical protein
VRREIWRWPIYVSPELISIAVLEFAKIAHQRLRVFSQGTASGIGKQDGAALVFSSARAFPRRLFDPLDHFDKCKPHRESRDGRQAAPSYLL